MFYVNTSSVVVTEILDISRRPRLKRHNFQRLDISPSSCGTWQGITHSYEYNWVFDFKNNTVLAHDVDA
jgi:hypothetical protein